MKLSFIGGGNMAQAMVGGLLAKKSFRADQIFVADPDAKARAKVSRLLKRGGQVSASVRDLRGLGSLVILAVKPQAMEAACREGLADRLRGEAVLSIAAGIRLDSISRWLKGHARLIRCMPNTPALIGAGITGAFARPAVSRAQRNLAQRVLQSVGKVVWLDDEALLDAVTAVSGSGPAYFFWLIEQLEAAGVALGLAPGVARELAIQTALGAAKLAARGKDSPASLRERVTSKGGTTEAALEVFAREALGERFRKAVAAARTRGTELGDILGKDA